MTTDTGLIVAANQTANITSAMLATTDAAFTASQLTYTVTTAPTNGILKDNGTALSNGSTFTQADINNGLLTFVAGPNQTNSSLAFTVADGGNVTTSGNFPITVGTVPPVLLNEIEANPPGALDNRYEYIELKGTPGASLNNVELVVFDGISADSDQGNADLVVNLSGSRWAATDYSSSRVLRIPAIPFLRRRRSFPIGLYFTQSGGLPNGTLSFYLFDTPNAFVQGTDYDTNKDGILDNLPTGAIVLDDVALLNTSLGIQVTLRMAPPW